MRYLLLLFLVSCSSSVLEKEVISFDNESGLDSYVVVSTHNKGWEGLLLGEKRSFDYNFNYGEIVKLDVYLILSNDCNTNYYSNIISIEVLNSTNILLE